MSLDSNALTTLTEVKDYLGLSASTDHDTKLEMLINAASRMVASFCGREFVSQAYAGEFYDGTGTPELVLNQRPVISVTSIYEDSDREFESDDLLVAEDDYVVDLMAGVVTRTTTSLLLDEESSDAVWTNGFQTIKVTYVAGYATVPFDVQQACVELTAHYFNNRGRLGLNSMSLGGLSISFGQEGIPKYIQTVLEPHRAERF